MGRRRLEKDNINYFEEKVYAVDSTVFDIFSFKFLMGDPQTALDAPRSIVLNKTLADRIFKGEDPMGKVLKSDDSLTLTVKGVYEDMPENSHLIAHAMISSSTNPAFQRNNNWGGFSIQTYVKLNPNVKPEDFEPKLEEINKKYVATIFDQFGIKIKYELWPITKIHLYSDFEGEPEPLGDIRYIYIFSIVGAFLLIIACINYMNLATSRSVSRALEVGVRKVMGAKKGELVGQFLAESMLLSFFALLISLILLTVLVPIFNQMLGLHLALSNLLRLDIILIILGVVLFTGFLAGSYPAFYLSAFMPVKVLKGSLSGRSGNKQLRRTLVGLQFAISMFMFVGTAIIYKQMQYVQNKDLGFDKEQVIRFRLNNPELRAKWPVFKNKLLQSPDISRVGTGTSVPGQGYSKQLMEIENEDGSRIEKGLDFYLVDYDYFPTLKIDLIDGRNFSKNYGSDSATAVIVNEATVRRMNWSKPLGKKISFNAGNDSIPPMRVVGVVKDFHQQSLYNPITALVFMPRLNNGNALVKIDRNLKNSLAYVESTWNELFPGVPFEYNFLEERFLEQYETDQLRGTLFLAFSMMTIVIACLGLLGLASFTAEQRSKEISIRKVLGANVFGLVSLLVRDFVFLVVIAAIPAFGLAVYFMNQWLQNFEYHTNLGVLSFALVLFATLLVTVLTTGFHALKAARANPADNLKYE